MRFKDKLDEIEASGIAARAREELARREARTEVAASDGTSVRTFTAAGFSMLGLRVGDVVAFHPHGRGRWYVRAWRWIARNILRRRPPLMRIVSITRHTLTIDRPADGE